jgi:dipeptidyl aminopeptidase/acylaminoacyl peptidase
MSSVLADEIAQIEQRIAVLTRRLRLRETQIAGYGHLDVPPHMVLDKEAAVQEVAQARAELFRLCPGLTDAPPPYLGLRTFQEADADRFFGREVLIADLLKKVERAAFLAVLGPSGSGKSSVVRAGLIPLLKSGVLPGSDSWCYVTLKPGERPLDALAVALTKLQSGDLVTPLGDSLSSAEQMRDLLERNERALLLATDILRDGAQGTRLVLVVDQAEELWTMAPPALEVRTTSAKSQQRLFVQLILSAVRALDTSVLVILTMRADFLHCAAGHRDLSEAIARNIAIVSPMRPDELRSAILRPAEALQCGFEPGLVDELIAQTVGREGALPLLEYTLLELWKTKQKGLLTWESFHMLGGVEGGLARRADTILSERYPPDRQQALRQVLLRLVQPGEGVADTRRRARMDELIPVGGTIEDIQALLKPLADERLITTGRDPVNSVETIEISHEALIRAWPTLNAWISVAREDLRFQLQLSEAAAEWRANGENDDFLWAGLRLARAEEWLVRAQPLLNVRDQAFLDASHDQARTRAAANEAARQRELAQAQALAAAERRDASRLRRFLVIGSVLLLIATVAAVTAGWFWRAADRSEHLARARLLVSEGQRLWETQPLLGLRLAFEGLTMVPTDDVKAREAILDGITDMVKTGRVLNLGDDIKQIFPTLDGEFVIVGHTQRSGELRHTADNRLIARLAGPVSDVDFSPDAARVFVVNYRDDKIPAELRRTVDGSLITQLSGSAKSIIFSTDEAAHMFVVSYYDDKIPAELRRTIDGKLISQLSGAVDFVFDVDFSSDESASVFVVRYHANQAFSGSQTFSELRRTADGSIVPLPSVADGITLSPDAAARVFVVSYRGQGVPAELRRTADGTLIARFTNPISSYNVNFSSDEPASVFVVDHDHKTPSELRRTADGSLIFSGFAYIDIGSDVAANVFVVNYRDNKTPSELRRTTDGSLITTLSKPADSITFSPDAATNVFVVNYWDNKTPSELRRTTDGSLITTLSKPADSITFSPDAATNVFVVEYLQDNATGAQEAAELRRTADGSLITRLSGTLTWVVFSPDPMAKIMALGYANNDLPVELRTSADGTLMATLTGSAGPYIGGQITFSPNPQTRTLVVSYTDGRSEVWDWQGIPRRLADLGLGKADQVFDSQGRRVVVRYSDGRAYLLDIDWLRAMGGDPTRLSEQELVDLACKGPLASKLWALADQADLQKALDAREPQACQ